MCEGEDERGHRGQCERIRKVGPTQCRCSVTGKTRARPKGSERVENAFLHTACVLLLHNVLDQYRVCARGDRSRVTIAEHHISSISNEAIEPPTVNIIMRFSRVVL
jgi:hypothetical protein